MATIRDSPTWNTMTEEEKRKALHEERVRVLLTLTCTKSHYHFLLPTRYKSKKGSKEEES